MQHKQMNKQRITKCNQRNVFNDTLYVYILDLILAYEQFQSW